MKFLLKLFKNSAHHQNQIRGHYCISLVFGRIGPDSHCHTDGAFKMKIDEKVSNLSSLPIAPTPLTSCRLDPPQIVAKIRAGDEEEGSRIPFKDQGSRLVMKMKDPIAAPLQPSLHPGSHHSASSLAGTSFTPTELGLSLYGVTLCFLRQCWGLLI